MIVDFDTKMKTFLANVPEYETNEAAIAAGRAVGKPYWCGPRLLKVIAQ